MRDIGFLSKDDGMGANCQFVLTYRTPGGKYTPDERKGHFVIFELGGKRKQERDKKKIRAEVMERTDGRETKV